MKNKTIYILNKQPMRLLTAPLFFFMCFNSLAQSRIAVRNVNVVDVVHQKIIPTQTVIIDDGKIISISRYKANDSIDNGKNIDGNGKYLLPGLVDAHVHFFQSGGIYTRPDAIDLRKYVPYEKEMASTHAKMEDLLKRYTAAGITTVIDVGSSINFLKQRDSLKNRSFAPEIYMTGPLLTTWEPAVYHGLGNDAPFYLMLTPEDARKSVREQLGYKPDFIKIWYIVRGKDTETEARKTLPQVAAVIDEAHKHGLKVAVHATEKITAQLSVENGADYLVHGIDDEIIDDKFIALLKNKKTILCPTLAVGSNYGEVFRHDYQLSIADHSLADPEALSSLFDLKHLPDTALVNRYRLYATKNQASGKTSDSILMVNLDKINKGGIIIATGTDAGNIGTMHASSYYEEIELMKRSGMTNWDILKASTINGAKVLGKENEFGTIEKGKMANLVLLNANPVEQLENLQEISMVFNKGKAFIPDSLLPVTALTLVQRQLNAYNDHNLDAFLEPYADDVEIYTFPSTLMLKGKAGMRERYAFHKEAPGLHCEIVNRIINGNTVIDHERVTNGKNVINAIAIYTISDKKIKKVHFIRNE